MLKNIIFDMGNVLVNFDPLYILKCHDINDPEDVDLFLKNVFYSDGWKKMDLGIYDEDDLYNDAITRLPTRLHSKCREILDSWYYSMTPINGMKELIKRLKDQGFDIYLLSNAGRSKDIYWNKIPGSEYFSGEIVSAFEGCIKPDRKIYEILLNRFSLNAEECLFIDDMQANIDGARTAGIDAWLFDKDVEALERYINNHMNKGGNGHADK